MNNYELEKQRLERIQKSKFDMYAHKRDIVKSQQSQLQKEVARKECFAQEQLKEKELRRESIRQMALKGKQTVDNYKRAKQGSTKAELAAKTEEEKKLIYKLEREAQQLEGLEE